MDYTKPKIESYVEWNYCYFPILLRSEELVIKCVNELKAHWINPRRYFFPPLTCLPYVKNCETPVANDIASRVLCLPLYPDLTFEEIEIEGSSGLTLNATVQAEIKSGQHNKLNLSLGFPLLVRKVRPDGLTRSFVMGVEYLIGF